MLTILLTITYNINYIKTITAVIDFISFDHRLELETLLTYSTLIYSKFKATNAESSPFENGNNVNQNIETEVVSEENNEFDFNDMVSSFWQDNDLDADIMELDTEKEMKNNDEFSDNEINELRGIFQSQTVSRRLNASQSEIAGNESEAEKRKGDVDKKGTNPSPELKKTTVQADRLSEISQLSDNAPDEFFFVPDINKTIERSLCSTDENQTSNEIESGLLGESPKKRLIPSVTGASVGANFYISKSSSSNTYKSSLEALATDSPKPDLSVGSSKPFIEEYRSSYGSSANADTEPISDSTYQAALLEGHSAYSYPMPTPISKETSSVSKKGVKKGDSSESRKQNAGHSSSVSDKNMDGSSVAGQNKTKDSFNGSDIKYNSLSFDAKKKDDSSTRVEKMQEDSLNNSTKNESEPEKSDCHEKSNSDWS